MTKDLGDLCARFRWTADRVDGWRVLDAPAGPLRGDCDDFALTALWLVCGGSWLRLWWLVATFQAVFWYSRLPSGGGHMMLWMRGRGWIDNIYPNWSDCARHRRVFPVLLPVAVIKLASGALGGVHERT